MTKKEWDWMTVEDAVLAHQQSISNFGGSDGIRDEGGLGSALAYPKNLDAYGDPGMVELAAGFLFAIAKNHAFVDGDKRTAWTVMRLFVGLNGGKLNYDKLEAVKFVEGVASGTIDYEGARDWIAARLK